MAAIEDVSVRNCCLVMALRLFVLSRTLIIIAPGKAMQREGVFFKHLYLLAILMLICGCAGIGMQFVFVFLMKNILHQLPVS